MSRIMTNFAPEMEKEINIMCETTRNELYHNNEFKVISLGDEAGATSRVILVYDVDLHCATILSYYPKTDTYDVTPGHAFHRAWVVLSASYDRDKLEDLWIDPRALYQFLRGVKDYLRAKRQLIKIADDLCKKSLNISLFGLLNNK